MRSPARTRIPRWRLRPVAALAVGALALFAGCARVPELVTAVRGDLRDSDYPELRPIEGLADPLPEPAAEAAKLEEALEWRRRALERQARALRQSAVGGSGRSRVAPAGAGDVAPGKGADTVTEMGPGRDVKQKDAGG